MKKYQFFQHQECEFFPCHKKGNPEDFNCLFCYCPLYALKKDCGGAFVILENGIKDCSSCLIVHSRKGYEHVMSKIGLMIERTQESIDEKEEIS